MTTATEPNAALLLHFTTFANHGAAEKRELTWTWQQLVDYLMTPKTYSSKDACPWIKLARFGEIRTEKNSLRHNANVLGITGIEGDYDAGQLSVADAATMLTDAGIEAFFYTSPRHTPDKPRWRVLCPLSQELPPERRRALVGRLNGVLGGVLTRESFALSQSFYYGRIEGREYQVQQVRGGRCVDVCDGLPEITPHQVPDAQATMLPASEDDAAREEHIVEGHDGYVYAALRDLAAAHAARGIAEGDTIAYLYGLLSRCKWRGRDPRTWEDRRDDVVGLVQSARRFRPHINDDTFDLPADQHVVPDELFAPAIAEATMLNDVERSIEELERPTDAGVPLVVGRADLLSEADRPPRFDSVDAMLDDAVFTAAAGGSVVLLSRPHVAYTLSLFSALTAASTFTPADGRKPVRTCGAWLAHPARKTLDSVAFAPGEPRFCRDPGNANLRSVNMWSPFGRSRCPDDWPARVEPFLEHVYYVIPSTEDAGRFLDWLAHIEQCPGVLPHGHWLLIAPKQGVGRNWIAAALSRVWPGAVACGGELDGVLGGSFNGLIARKLLNVIDEVRVGDGSQWKHAERLKNEMTATHRQINLKYGAQYVELNCLRWLMFSNHRDAMPLSPEDRRVNVSEWGGELRTPEHYTRIYRMLDDPLFIQSIARFLAERDIRDFNPGEHAPMNQAKRDMIQSTKSEMTLKVEALIAERSPAGTPPSKSDVITVARIWLEIGDDELSPEFKRQQGVQLNKALLAAGAVRYPGRFRLSRAGGMQTIWFLRNSEHWLVQTIDVIKEAAATALSP